MKKDGYRYPAIPKRELTKMVMRSLFLTAVALPALLVLSNHKTNPIVADALWGKSSREKPTLITETSLPHADVLAVLGGGLEPNGDGFDLNRFQKRRERAAAIGVAEFGMSDRVLLLDGLKPDNADVYMTKYYFIEQAKLLVGGKLTLPEDAISVETDSTSTATNLDALKKYMKSHNLKDAIIVTDEFHRVRTEALLKIKKINARVVTVEQIMALYSPEELYYVVERQNLEKNEEWERSEKLKLFTLFFDAQGEITADIERFYLGVK